MCGGDRPDGCRTPLSMSDGSLPKIARGDAPVYVRDGARREPFEPTVRPRIVERLLRAGEYPVTVLVAPAGFGKTVAVRQFLNETGRGYLRFSVQREHTSLLSFTRAFMAVVSPESAGAAAIAYGNAQRSKHCTRELARWVAHFLDGSTTIFIDDLQRIQKHRSAGREIASFLEELVEATKARIKWIIATRSPLDLPLASWLARGTSDLPIDEIELVLTKEEAHAIAASLGISSADFDASSVFDLVQGLPFALAMALSMWRNGENTFAVANATKKRINQFFNEYVFSELDAPVRAFLLKTALFRELNVKLLVTAGWPHAGEVVSELRRSTFCLSEDETGVFRHHDLFQEFLEEQLQASGEKAVREVYRYALAANEASGRIDQALALAVEFADSDAILRLFREHATPLFEQGHLSLLDQAVHALDDARRENDAYALYVRGLVAMVRGDFDDAMTNYRNALQRTGPDSKLLVQISLHFSGLLGDASLYEEEEEVIERASAVCSGDAGLDMRMEARKRTYGLLNGRGTLELADISRLRDLVGLATGRTQTELLHTLALAMFYGGSFERAREYAVELLQRVKGERRYRLAQRVVQLLAIIADDLDERDRAMELTLLQYDYAEKVGDLLSQSLAMLERFYQAVEAGEDEIAELAERRVLDIGFRDLQDTTRSYVPARLMQMGGAGKFEEGAAWLAEWLEATPLQKRGVRERDYFTNSQFAFYYAAGGLERHAREFLNDGREESPDFLGAMYSSRHRYEGYLWSALAYLVLGEHEHARRLVALVERDQANLRDTSVRLWRAVDQLRLLARSKAVEEYAELERCLADLRAHLLGGYARLYEALAAVLETQAGGATLG